MKSARAFLPGAIIGVMGGGQLGRMLAFEARRMGYRIHIFTPEENSPAAQIADRATIADYGDEDAVRRFVREIDVLTFEFENIPSKTADWCADICPVRPAGEILHIAQNRLREKEFLQRAGVPVAPFRRVRCEADLAGALREIGQPAILKTAAFGYDGKGQRLIGPGENATAIWAEQSAADCVLEGVVAFKKELSVLIARGADGASRSFPICENIHRAQVLDVTLAPARVSAEVGEEAAALARTIADRLDLVGLLAIEFFLAPDGHLIVNEMAPRPHNSGHWTIEACATSQFEQQLRAVCGLPLGSTELLRPVAMVNLLGHCWQNGEPGWAAALAVENACLHLYGKNEPRPRRKMGHITAWGADVEMAMSRALAARAALQER